MSYGWEISTTGKHGGLDHVRIRVCMYLCVCMRMYASIYPGIYLSYVFKSVALFVYSSRKISLLCYIIRFSPYRIQLPPEEVLQYVQASAIREHYDFVDGSTTGASQNPGAPGTTQGTEILRPLTWRDVRYQEMLRATKPSPTQGLSAREPTMLANIRSFMNKVVVTTSSIGSSSSTAETSSSKRSKSSFHVMEREPEGEMARGYTEQKDPDPEAALELAPSSSVNMQVETSRTCTRINPWAWVAEHDELSLAMKQGWVLYGFVEAPITFPPSFKWKTNASAGNFTDMATLQQAYTTRKKHKEGQSALRPPSYTDRITCSSQRDSRWMLKIKKYDMCDAICASDHRPVSAAIDILVRDLPSEKERGKDKGKQSEKEGASPAASDTISNGQNVTTGISSALPDSARLIKIRLYNLQIRWSDSLTSAGSESAPIPLSVLRSLSMRSSSIGSKQGSFGSLLSRGSNGSQRLMDVSVGAHTCMVYFPLQNEDPLSEFRKPLLINQALDVGTGAGEGLLTGSHVRYIHTFRLHELKDGVMEIRTLACMERAR